MQSQDETPTLQTSWILHLKDQEKLKSSDRPSVQYEYEGKNQTLIIFEVCFDSIKRSEGEGDQKLTNQFSYVERATQTMNNTLKVITIIMVATLMSRVLYSEAAFVIVVVLLLVMSSVQGDHRREVC